MVQTTSTKVCPEALNPTSCLFIRFPCVVSFRMLPWFHLLWIIPAKTGQILRFFFWGAHRKILECTKRKGSNGKYPVAFKSFLRAPGEVENKSWWDDLPIQTLWLSIYCHACKEKSLETTWNKNACHLGSVDKLLLHTKLPHWVANASWIAEAGTLFLWSSFERGMFQSITFYWSPSWSGVWFLGHKRHVANEIMFSFMLLHKTRGLSSQLAMSINKHWHEVFALASSVSHTA